MSGEIETIPSDTTLLPEAVDDTPATLQDVLLEMLDTPYRIKDLEQALYKKNIKFVSQGYLKGYLNALVDIGTIFKKNIDNLPMYSSRPEYLVTRRRCTNCNALVFVYNFSTEVTCPKCNQKHNVQITFDSGAVLKPV